MKKDTDLNKIKHFHIDICNIFDSNPNIETFYRKNDKTKNVFVRL